MQSLPRKKKGKNKLSANTLAAAYEFGLASTVARSIRKSASYLFEQSDVEMPSRLVSAVLRGLRNSPQAQRLQRDMHDADLSPLQGFEMNRHSPMSGVIPVKAHVSHEADGSVRVQLPAFSIKDLKCPYFKRRSKHFKLRIALMAFDFREQYFEYLSVKDFILNNEQSEAIDWKIEEKASPGLVIMLAMTLSLEVRYADGSAREVNQHDWSPGCIVDAWHQPEKAEQPRAGWRERYDHHSQQGTLALFNRLHLVTPVNKPEPGSLTASKAPPEPSKEGIPKGKVRFN